MAGFKYKGTHVRNLRIKLGLSQSQFARIIGYSSRVSVSQIENGHRGINEYSIEIIIKKFNVEYRELGFYERNSTD